MSFDRAVYNKAYHEINRERNSARSRANHLKDCYDLSPAEYEVLLVTQSGVCAICEQPETLTNLWTGCVRSLTVDHDHTTGQVRGLLCTRCNRRLGLLESQELIEWTHRARAYLQEGECKR